MEIDDVKTVAVIGAGDMGHGIAEVALIADYKVYLQDIKQTYLDRGVCRIDDSLKKLVSKDEISPAHHRKIMSNLLVPCLELEDAIIDADLVIESTPEIMDLKKKLFKTIDAGAPHHAILVSNTSSLKITELASVTDRPEKFIGMHYCNPAILMKTVEVIRGDKTSDESMQIGVDFILRNNKIPVRVEKDVPGFIINRVQAPRGVLLGCILDAGEISPESVDAYMKSLGMPMGPYETMDYTGIDIVYHGSLYFAEAVHPDYTPGLVIEALFTAGNFGKKSGKGIYDWSDGRPLVDLSLATDKIDFMDLVAVQVNEATKIIELGVCRMEDIDTAIVNGTASLMGPMSIVKELKPAVLSKRLEILADKYKKEIFRPTNMIKNGDYKN
jgi:enoyl-CoA hydratase / 3-hydroxyacyl-CoA dehydrogenase